MKNLRDKKKPTTRAGFPLTFKTFIIMKTFSQVMEKLAIDLYFYIDKNQAILTPNWKLCEALKNLFQTHSFLS